MERALENPRANVRAETQHEVALMTVETGLLEELPYECPSSSDHHSDDQFALSPSHTLTKVLPLSTLLRRITSHQLRPERNHQLKQNFR